MDNELAEELMKINKSIGKIDGKLEGILKSVTEQKNSCSITTADIYRKVEENTKFRSYMKGVMAFASISSVTALILGIVRVFMG